MKRELKHVDDDDAGFTYEKDMRSRTISGCREQFAKEM